jgi:hypothetical protein
VVALKGLTDFGTRQSLVENCAVRHSDFDSRVGVVQ